MLRARWIVGAVVAAVGAVAGPVLPATADVVFVSALSGAGSVRADFNGDGRDDLAVGAPLEDLGGLTEAGQVTVIYGSAAGLDTSTSQLWNQDSPGIADRAEEDDEFGTALAAGDFDGDGRDDLAVGVCQEDGVGAVNVILGSPAGLAATGNQFFSQGTPGIGGAPEPGDNFGCSLAAGDFDDDDRVDLAVGAFGEDSGSDANSGAVNVLYGAPGGLTVTGNQVFTQGTGGVDTTAAPGDIFGSALAAGDYNGDGRDDLAAGAPGEDLGLFNQHSAAGAVNVLYGGAAGLSGSGSQLWHQGSSGIEDNPEDGDSFGFTLESGDLVGNGRDDLVVGVPSESIDLFANKPRAGAVHVIPGSSNKLTATGSLQLNQDEDGAGEGPADANDGYGKALTVADYNGNGKDDLAVGVPGEDVLLNVGGTVSQQTDAGLVDVYYQASPIGQQFWHQSQPGILDSVEAGDLFGRALASGDYDGDNLDDLAVGIPGEDLPVLNEGAAAVIRGSADRLTGSGNQLVSQTDTPDLAEANDQFGFQLG
jgi:hypothetical protein